MFYNILTNRGFDESMKISRISEIIGKFKRFCNRQGWKTSQSYDWIEADDGYHNFLWAREVSPESFRRITADKKCVVREGLSYRIEEATYTAWLFPETPPKCLIKTVRENPDYSKRIALYDLSQVTGSKNLCAKLNNTESSVFHEFENFLQTELNVKVKPIAVLTTQDVDGGTYPTPTIA